MPPWSTHSSPARASDTAPTRQGYRLTDTCDTAQPGLTKPAASRQRLLDSSPKASAQWRQEVAFRHFESQAGAES